MTSKRWRCPWGGCTAVIPSFDLVETPGITKRWSLPRELLQGHHPGAQEIFSKQFSHTWKPLTELLWLLWNHWKYFPHYPVPISLSLPPPLRRLLAYPGFLLLGNNIPVIPLAPTNGWGNRNVTCSLSALSEWHSSPWVPIWPPPASGGLGNARIQIQKHLEHWLEVIFRLFWPYPSVCKSSLQHLPEESAGDFGSRRGTMGDQGVPGAQCQPLVELRSSSHPKHQQGPECIPQARDTEIQDSLRCSQGTRSRNGLGRSTAPMNPQRGEMDPACGEPEGPSQGILHGDRRNRGTS